jgi:ferric-dicitrate binding protein FerR (iron transport regulator)
MRSWLEMNPSTLVLARGIVASVRLSGRACRVSCVAGRLWVTASGRPEDSVLGPGNEVSFAGRGRIVVEALRTATVRIEIDTPTRVHERASLPLGRQPASA